MRVVLSGGPGAGKTVIANELARRRPERYAVVPEAAGQVYHRLRTRWDRLDLEGRRRVQRLIYQLQVEQEAQAAAAHAGSVLLLDRGTVDGSAYWPDGPEAYWRELQTTHEAELARYEKVIWLESCAAIAGLYDGSASNPVRFEDRSSALATGDRLYQVWQMHPRLIRISACADIEQKIRAVEAAI